MNLPVLHDPKDLLSEISIIVPTDQNYQEICEALLIVKANITHLDTEEAKIADPQIASLKALRAWFGQPRETYSKIEALLKSKIAEYQGQLRARKALAVAQLTATGAPDARGTLAELSAAPQPPGIQTREVWDFELCDAAAVPREYLVPNLPAIRALAGKGVAVPGVRFFKKTVVAAATRRAP